MKKIRAFKATFITKKVLKLGTVFTLRLKTRDENRKNEVFENFIYKFGKPLFMYTQKSILYKLRIFLFAFQIN